MVIVNTSRNIIIILIIVDCLRYDYTDIILQFMPRTWKHIVFRRFYAAGPCTWVSYPSIFSSTCPMLFGVSHIRNRFSFVEVLARHGYATIGIPGDQPFLVKERGFSKGFSIYLEPSSELLLSSAKTRFVMALENASKNIIRRFGPRYADFAGGLLFSAYVSARRLTNPNSDVYAPSFELVNKAINMLKLNLNRNIFLFIHFMELHYPYLSLVIRNNSNALNVYVSTLAQLLIMNGVKVPLANQVVKRIKEFYEQSLRVVGFSINMLLNFLEELALKYNYEPYVVITADHGEGFLEHGVLGHDGLNLAGVRFSLLYNEFIHVPLIIASPELDKSVMVDDVAGHVDLAPTILEMARVKDRYATRLFMGKSLLGYTVNSGFAVQREYVTSEAPAVVMTLNKLVSRTYAIINHRYKYIWHPVLGEELYDLVKDPAEKVNIASDNPDVVKEYRRRLKEHMMVEKRFQIAYRLKIKLMKSRER